MKRFILFIIFFSCLFFKYGHSCELNSRSDSPLRFDPYTFLGFEVAHREGIKGSGSIAIVDNGHYVLHPALEHVNWINCTNNGDDKSLYEYFQKQLDDPSKSANVHPLMMAGIIASKPLEAGGEGLPGIDYNIGLAHEARVEVYLTKVCFDESFESLSAHERAIKTEIECANWIQALARIKDSAARVICISCALPYDVQFEIDNFIKKQATGIPYIRQDVLRAIQDCVSDKDNEKLLVISASNTAQTIGEYDGRWKSIWSFKHLEELANDPIISKRLIIVGNSALGLTGHELDRGHPELVKNLKDYYEALKTYLNDSGRENSF